MAWEKFKRTNKYKITYQYKTEGIVWVEARNKKEAVDIYFLAEDYGNHESTITGTHRIKKVEEVE
jgi:tRNA(Phe) wybutosine-synthesizing methylase Tyw3